MDSEDSLENLNISSQSDNAIMEDLLNVDTTRPTDLSISDGNSIEDLNKKIMDLDGNPENLNIHNQSNDEINSNSLNINSARNEIEMSDGNLNEDLNEKNTSEINDLDDNSNFVNASPIIEDVQVPADDSIVNSKSNNMSGIHQSDDNCNLVNASSNADDVEISRNDSVVHGDLNDDGSLPDISVSHLDDENRNLSNNEVSEMPCIESDMSDDENNVNPNHTEEFADSDKEIDQPPSSRKKTSLPYFHLPNPDLDSYITNLGEEFQCRSKEKNLLKAIPSSRKDKKDDIEFIIDLKENETSFESKRSWGLPKHCDPVSSHFSPDVGRASSSSSKNLITSPSNTIKNGDIEFILELTSDETSFKNKRSFKLPNQPKIDSSESTSDVNGGESNNRDHNEYMKMFSSLNQMDNDKIPGLKRTALKDFLKKKIDEKKVKNFSKSVEIAKIDEELDNEEFENIESESEENFSDCEKSESVHAKNDSENEDDKNSDGDDSSPEEENLFNFSASVKELDRDSRNMSPLSVLETEENVDSERIDSPELLPIEQLENEGHYGSDDDDDFDRIKTKKVKSILEESEDELESDKENKEEIISENSDLNKVALLQRSNQLFNSSQISSSLPSYQPVRSSFDHIQSKDSETEDSDSESKVKHSQLKISDMQDESLSQLDSRSFNAPAVSEDCESLPDLRCNPIFGLALDNLPVTQTSKFSSQDLMDVCSGEFNKNVVDEQEFENDSRSCISEDDNKKVPLKIKDFIEDEAELSGDEMEHVGDDDDEDCENDEELAKFCVQDTDLPSQEIIRDEIAGLHFKQMLNDDEELIQQFQERFIEENESLRTNRKRKFAWENSENADYKAGSSSDSDEENDVVDSWCTANQDKAKWRQENEAEDIPIESDLKKKKFNISVLGQPQFAENKEFKMNQHKRPRGSFLIFNDDKASSVMKKITLAGDAEEASGSRTTRHFIFRNSLPSSNSSNTKDNHVFQGISNSDNISINESIFKKI